jgi:uncharacterized protein YxjI
MPHFMYQVLSSIKVEGKVFRNGESVALEEEVGDELAESGHVALESSDPVEVDDSTETMTTTTTARKPVAKKVAKKAAAKKKAK